MKQLTMIGMWVGDLSVIRLYVLIMQCLVLILKDMVSKPFITVLASYGNDRF